MSSATIYPKISFGVIVLNGEPFTRYCLRSLYPYAHEIIVVEGAVQGAKAVATPDGHSQDGTLEVLRRFKVEEDPENKLTIVSRNGFWSEKDEQSRAYASRVTGDWLWQVDIDEFYLPRDMEFIFSLLRDEPCLTALSFMQLSFWGSPHHVCDSTYLMREGAIFHRLFRWQPGFRYLTHRPPTVVDLAGVNLREINPVNAMDLAATGVRLYHYHMLFPKQVREKVAYYKTWPGAAQKDMPRWMEEDYFKLTNPFNLHNVTDHPGWLLPYEGSHPPQAMAMWNDAIAGNLGIEIRPMEDVNTFLTDPAYRKGIFAINQEYSRRKDQRLSMDDPTIKALLHPGSRSKLRVVQINTHESCGGAAQVQHCLSSQLIKRDYEVRTLVRQVDVQSPWCEQFFNPRIDPPKAFRSTSLLDYGLASSFYLLQKKAFLQADIVHLHNLHGGYFNPLTLPIISALKPSVWTLHDMQPLTGHCAQAIDCNEWLNSSCLKCTQLNAYPALSQDVSAELFRDKRVMARLLDVCIVTPSQWLMNLVQASFLAHLPSKIIPNGIDTHILKPRPRAECRKMLGLPENACILVFTADGGLKNPYKGGSYLEHATRVLGSLYPDLVLLNVGGDYRPEGLRTFTLPYITDKNLLAIAYSAGDVFAYPTLADSFSLVVAEAMACGLPVVSFRTGGVPEVVLDGESGIIVDYKDQEQFIKALRALISKPKLRHALSKGATARGAYFSLERATDAYIDIYEETIERRLRNSSFDIDINRRVLEYLQARLKSVGNLSGVLAYQNLLEGKLDH